MRRFRYPGDLPDYDSDLLESSDDESTDKYRKRQRVALHVAMLVFYRESAQLKLIILILCSIIAWLAFFR